MTLNRTSTKATESQDEATSMASLALSLAGVDMESAPGNVRAFGDVHGSVGSVSSSLAATNRYEWKGPSAGFSSFSDDLARASTPEQQARPRGESIDLFLSKSPSQTLGNDLLNFGNQDAPAANGHSGGELTSAAYGFMPHTSQVKNQDGRRDISPTASVAGTSASTCSRSQSPSQHQSHLHGQHIRGGISAASAFEHEAGLAGRRNISHASLASAEENYDAGRPHRMQVHQGSGAKIPAGTYSSNGAHAPIIEEHLNMDEAASAPMLFPFQKPPQQGAFQSSQPPTSNQQQIFYMAVATQDGRQVLQPVQVVQIPGQASPAVVLPTGMAINAATLSHPQAMQGSTLIPQVMMVPPSGAPQGNVGAVEFASPSNAKKYDPRRSKVRSGNHHGNTGAQRVTLNTSAKSHNLQYGNIQGQRARNDENVAYENPKDVGYSGEHVSYSHGSTPTNSRGPSPRSSPTHHDAIATLYAAPQRPPLDELLGNVRRLSRDQVGCRLLQQALDEEGPLTATMILEEGLSFWGEAMVDPFGNYLFQKILEKITTSERVVLVRSVSARLVNASLNLHGTRSVQKVIELCAADESIMSAAKNGFSSSSEACEDPAKTAASILTRALTPAAARLCIDSHGNHVIQRILLKLPQRHSHFVFEAVAASVGDVARHRHGCCVIQRCLDSPPSEARSHLVDRIVENALELMQDAYGNYVVQYVLDVCGDKDVHVVCDSVVGRVNSLAIQKFSSNVVEKCLERCTDKVREQYLDELSDPDRIRELMMDPFGNYVIQRALSVATHAQATRLVDAIKPHLLSSQQGGQSCAGLRNTAGGRRILAKICRRFPNFNLEDPPMYQAPAGNHGYRRNTQQHHLLHPMPMNQSNISSPPANHSSFQGSNGGNNYRQQMSRHSQHSDGDNGMPGGYQRY